jgi:hypothetical protein
MEPKRKGNKVYEAVEKVIILLPGDTELKKYGTEQDIKLNQIIKLNKNIKNN